MPQRRPPRQPRGGRTAAVVPGGLAGELAAAWAGEPDLDGLRLVSAEPPPDTAPIAARELDVPDEVAFLQYTSGSTSVPTVETAAEQSWPQERLRMWPPWLPRTLGPS